MKKCFVKNTRKSPKKYPAIKKLKRKLSEDIRYTAIDMSKVEAQYMIKDFYKFVENLMATKEHGRILVKQHLQGHAISFISREIDTVRNHMTEFLDLWSEKFPEACWVKSIPGFGPVIAAGLVAFIDLEKCPTISSLWKYAGQSPDSRPLTNKELAEIVEESTKLFGDLPSPTKKHIHWLAERVGKKPDTVYSFCTHRGKKPTWEKLYLILKRPTYNVTLKKVCTSIGDCLIKTQGANPYTEWYRERKIREQALNEKGTYRKQALKQLERFHYRPEKAAYKSYIQGKLPGPHITARAKRWAVKIFLAHFYMVMYYIRYGKAPPDVYALDRLKGQQKLHIPRNPGVPR